MFVRRVQVFGPASDTWNDTPTSCLSIGIQDYALRGGYAIELWSKAPSFGQWSVFATVSGVRVTGHPSAGSAARGGLLRGRAARAALHWCFEQKADLVVLSGDITDSGREEEWQVLHGLLAVADRSRPTPGHSRESRPHDHPGDLPGDRWAARPGPREAVPLLCPTRPRPPLASRVVFHDDRSGALREMLRRCEDYALAYDRTPPRLGTQREQRRGLGAQLRQIMRPGDRATSRRPRDLREYVPPVIVPDALAAEAARDRGTSWPTVDQPLYRDLLELVYPITLYEDARYVVVGLNSNTIPALSIVDGAIGMLGRGQLDRLEGLLRARSGKCAILVLHHHLGCPPWRTRPVSAASCRATPASWSSTDTSTSGTGRISSASA